MLEGPIILKMTDKDLPKPNDAIPAARGDAESWGGTGGKVAVAQTKRVPRRRRRRRRRAGGRGGTAGRGVPAEAGRRLRRRGVVATFDRGGDAERRRGSDMIWRQQHPDGGTIFPRRRGARDENAGKPCPRPRSRWSTTPHDPASSTKGSR